MAKDINQVILTGRLTKDVELKFLESGNKVCTISIAVADDFKKGNETKKNTHFFDVECWGASAQFVNDYFNKGDGIVIFGSAIQNRWESEGKKQSRVVFRADRVSFPPSSAIKKNENGSHSSSNSDGYAHNESGPEPSKVGANDGTPDEFEDDDIPF